MVYIIMYVFILLIMILASYYLTNASFNLRGNRTFSTDSSLQAASTELTIGYTISWIVTLAVFLYIACLIGFRHSMFLHGYWFSIVFVTLVFLGIVTCMILAGLAISTMGSTSNFIATTGSDSIAKKDASWAILLYLSLLVFIVMGGVMLFLVNNNAKNGTLFITETTTV